MDVYGNVTVDRSPMELISMGIYGGSDHIFYGEVSDYDRSKSSEFVKIHIDPLLGVDSTVIWTRLEFRSKLLAFLTRYISEGVCICFDYSGDWFLFNQLLGCDLHYVYGRNVNQFINPSLVDSYILNHNLVIHHALSDAKANHYGYCGT
jgi:hypothetical protein